MQQQSKFRKYMSLISLGYMGGTIYVLMYIRYVFYDQMIETMNINNTQLGLLNTVCAVVGFIVSIPGAYLADKFDAKKIIVWSIGGMTALAFIYAVFIESYTAALIIWAAQSLVLFSYWPCLIKYINSLGSEDEAGSSFGMYYMINGLSGAFGNAAPLWISTHFGGFRSAMIGVGVITLIATILVWIFLDNEKKMAERGVYLKGDEPIQLRHVKYVLKWPGTYMLFLATFASYTVYSNISYFNPYLIDVIGIDPDTSSVFSVIRSYGAMLIAPVGGIMADKVFKSTSKWSIVAFIITGAMFAIVFLFGPESNPTLVSIYSVLPSLIIFAFYSITYSILRELHIPATVAGTAIGLGSLSATVGDALWPAAFGNLINKFGNDGYTYIFIILILDCVMGILNALWVRNHDRKCKSGQRQMDLSGVSE